MSIASEERFRLSRGGVLNVWQYDEQVFDFAEGRLLLRGANGAGKSKTLELLMPFVIDGDKARMTASGKHTTSLLWLMLDGHDGGGRTGYVWIEFARRTSDGQEVTMTCGVGLRASESARQATSWFFTSPRRVGVDLLLADETGPLSQAQLKSEVESDGEGRFFDSPRRYKEHVGRALFGLPVEQYDELLRLIYWLRQPQVGEDIDPKRLAEQLVNALPQVDDSAVRAAGDTFDELEAFGEEIERRDRAARAIREVVATYAVYARSVVAGRAAAVVEAATWLRRSESTLRRSERELSAARVELGDVDTGRAEQVGLADETQRRITALEQGPEARTRGRLRALAETVRARGEQSRTARRIAGEAQDRADRSGGNATDLGTAIGRGVGRLHDDARRVGSELSALGVLSGLGALVLQSASALDWQLEDATTDLAAALDTVAGWTRDVRVPAGERRAAILVVNQARAASEVAKERADRVEGEVAAAEGRVDQARERAAQAAQASRDLEADLLERLDTWQRDDDAVAFERPDLTVEGLGALESLARGATAGPVESLTDELARSGAAVRSAESRIAELRAERGDVAARRDPEPAPPAWGRTPREGRAGAPFWRLVDFRDDLGPDARAALEAGLESSGILDAWVRPDGQIVGRGDLDVWLNPAGGAQLAGGGSAEGADTLAAVLQVDGSGVNGDKAATDRVSSTVVAAVLSSIAVRDTIALDTAALDTAALDTAALNTAGAAADGLIAAPAADGSIAAGGPAAVVGLDGSWRLGPVSGRASKHVAQYIGASARAAERRRRLDDLDSQLADVEEALVLATAERARVRDQLARIQGWLEGRPRHDQVLRAWATEEEREQAV
uniref:hypothetical protein n=1 Tax=Lapillicoccus sp. TaxID=1909287 RepID=UPI0039831EFD